MHSPFAWLEAIAPPLLVLSTAYVLKEQLLDAIETRHANERAYQEAVNLWQSATADPERHPHWMQFYANALRDAIRKVNIRRRDALESLTTADWRMLVYRELQADNWYVQPMMEDIPATQTDVAGEITPPLAINANGNGAHPNGGV
jgi:hypothetical protein